MFRTVGVLSHNLLELVSVFCRSVQLLCDLQVVVPFYCLIHFYKRASRISCHLHRLKSSPCVTSLLLCSAPWERTRSPPPTWRRSSPLSELRRTKRGWPRWWPPVRASPLRS